MARSWPNITSITASEFLTSGEMAGVSQGQGEVGDVDDVEQATLLVGVQSLGEDGIDDRPPVRSAA
jgi:hypothetical protein